MNKPLKFRIYFAILLSAVALLLYIQLTPYVQGIKFLILYPIIFLIAWVSGLYPTLIAISLTTIIVHFRSGSSDFTEYLRLAIYLVTSICITWMIEYNRRREKEILTNLLKSTTEMTSIIEGMKDSFVSVDRNWKIVAVNRNYELSTNVSREKSIGKVLWQVFPEAANNNYNYWIESNRVMNTGVPVEFEEYYPPLNIWTEARIYPTDNGIALFFRDISKRKNAEIELIQNEKIFNKILKANEEKFESLANNIPQLSWMNDDQGNVFWYNQRWFDYTGTTIEDMQDQGWRKVHHPDYLEYVLRNFNNHLISGEPWEDVYPIKGKDGQFRWFLSRATPVKNEDGTILRWFGTHTDIDEQVKIEAELSESQYHFKRLADSIPHIIWTSKADGQLDFYNARYYEFTGVEQSNGELEQSWEALIHPDDYKRTIEIWNKSLASGTPYQIEYRFKDRFTGGHRWFLGLALPVKDYTGEIIKWFGSCTDIDDQKHLAEKIETQKEDLQNALIARDEFLSIASHELKTPLTSLKLHSQIFKKGVDKGIPDAYSAKRIDSLAEQVEKQVSKLNRLVDDMLDISRIRTGKLTLQPQNFDLNELINEVFEILNGQFTSSNYLEPIFKKDVESISVFWDRIRIEQVLINLLTNAIRYGNGKQIHLTLTTTDNKVFLNLKDNGIGIAKENLDKIFYRFEKIKNPNEVSGLGLGLFISKQIVDAHAGKLWVESELGVGSEFKIEMPR
ncbi:MAG: PAS domain S-box protein [Bacteriovorax sp.]|nr:PAS domain S-box protein [Bacteriovorax sp.]